VRLMIIVGIVLLALEWCEAIYSQFKQTNQIKFIFTQTLSLAMVLAVLMPKEPHLLDLMSLSVVSLVITAGLSRVVPG